MVASHVATHLIFLSCTLQYLTNFLIDLKALSQYTTNFEDETEMIKNGRKKAIMIEDHKEEPLDLISHLSNKVLSIILSSVPIDDVARSSSLSKR